MATRLIVVRRHRFTLDLYLRDPRTRTWSQERQWPIAVGMVGLRTPADMYEIQNRSRKPAYTYPDSTWVPEDLRGETFNFGDANNPIAERWMGLDPTGVGIHGTWARDSIGTEASHGCVRMLPEDVIELYDLVHKGTPVFVY